MLQTGMSFVVCLCFSQYRQATGNLKLVAQLFVPKSSNHRHFWPALGPDVCLR